jgi:hypothetical protein
MVVSPWQCRLAGMIYSVVPRELEPQLLEPLTARYADEPEVTVIVDRRRGERRSRRGDTPTDGAAHQRELRDRRRRRAGGDFAPLRGEGSLTSAA